jgi:GNAT superfamily N-acetyltransferase
MELTVRPLTPDLWHAFQDLFADNRTVSQCWCMYWRIGGEYHNRTQRSNKAALKRVVNQGPPPGLLAFDGDKAVGWCQLTPRADLPWLDHTRALQAVDDVPVWSISCFYIRKGYRKKGVTSALIAAAVETARRAGAPALEAYPLDPALSTSSSFTGYLSTFERASFKIVARRSSSRPIVRFEFKRTPPRHRATRSASGSAK